MFTRPKPGEYVKITNSCYSDIRIGEIGKMECSYSDPTTDEPGYGIIFTKFWSIAISHQKPPFESRILWFPIDAVEVCIPQPPEPAK